MDNIYAGIIKWKIEMIGERESSNKQKTGAYNGVSEISIYRIGKDLACVKKCSESVAFKIRVSLVKDQLHSSVWGQYGKIL